MIKNLFITSVFLFSMNAFANGSSGGVPNLPCYDNNEYIGTMELTKCKKIVMKQKTVAKK